MLPQPTSSGSVSGDKPDADSPAASSDMLLGRNGDVGSAAGSPGRYRLRRWRWRNTFGTGVSNEPLFGARHPCKRWLNPHNTLPRSTATLFTWAQMIYLEIERMNIQKKRLYTRPLVSACTLIPCRVAAKRERNTQACIFRNDEKYPELSDIVFIE